MKNVRKIHLSDGLAYANYFSKVYIVSYRKMPKQNKFTVSFLGKIPLKLKICLKQLNNFNPIPATSTAGPWPVIAILQLCAEGMATV